MYWILENDPSTGRAGPGSVKGYTLMYKVISNGGIQVFEIVTIVLVALFVASEFKYGNIRSEISYGHKRSDIYFSKMLSSMLGGVMVITSSMLTGMAAGTAFFGFGSPVDSGIILSLIKAFVLMAFVSTAFCSIYVMLSFLIRDPGVIVGIYIGFTVLISNFLVAQLSMRYEWFKNISDYFLQSQLINVASMEITGKIAAESIIYTIAVIIVSSLVRNMFFRKIDIT